MIPMDSILLNSALAAVNLSGGRRHARECMGGPLVGMKCSKPCLVDEQMKLGVVISRNCPRSVVYLSVGRVRASRWGGQSVRVIGTQPSCSINISLNCMFE